jgi:hypothetical protein
MTVARRHTSSYIHGSDHFDAGLKVCQPLLRTATRYGLRRLRCPNRSTARPSIPHWQDACLHIILFDTKPSLQVDAWLVREIMPARSWTPVFQTLYDARPPEMSIDGERDSWRGA